MSFDLKKKGGESETSFAMVMKCLHGTEVA